MWLVLSLLMSLAVATVDEPTSIEQVYRYQNKGNMSVRKYWMHLYWRMILQRIV